MLDSKINPYKLKILVRGQLEHSIWFDVKLGAEFDNVKISENSAHTELSIYLPAVCSVLRVVEAPVAHVSPDTPVPL